MIQFILTAVAMVALVGIAFQFFNPKQASRLLEREAVDGEGARGHNGKLRVEMYASSYSDRGFWATIRAVAASAGEEFVRLALSLYYVMTDNSVRAFDKSIIIGALGYLILGFDIVPDGIPAVGLADDLIVLKGVFKMVEHCVTSEIKNNVDRKAKQCFHVLDCGGRNEANRESRQITN